MNDADKIRRWFSFLAMGWVLDAYLTAMFLGEIHIFKLYNASAFRLSLDHYFNDCFGQSG